MDFICSFAIGISPGTYLLRLPLIDLWKVFGFLGSGKRLSTLKPLFSMVFVGVFSM